jgi:hypothetical protein
MHRQQAHMTGKAGHGRTHFFKYATTSTALAILTSSSVRYSSPLLFNDPFDLQTGMPLRFDMNVLPERLFARIEALARAAAARRTRGDANRSASCATCPSVDAAA